MSELSLNYVDSTINSVTNSLALRTGGPAPSVVVTRLAINTTGTVTSLGTYVAQNITAPTYNGYTPVNRAGDTMTGTLNSSNLQISGQSVYHPGNYNSIINRGNPGSGSTLLLERFDQVHVYSADGVNSIDIATNMVANSVYTVHYTTTASNANCDPYIAPNFTSYASQFSSFYYGSPQGSTGLPTVFNQTLPYFYFDHYGGALGSNPCGTFTLFNFIEKKHAIYHGGDTQSHAYGTSRWNNNSTVWTSIGTLAGITGMNVRVHVRRIG